MMQNVLSQINSKYRKLIEMRYLQELSYDEIAEKLDMPLGTVKAQLFRAKDLLSNILNKTKDNY
jgi:RNA polymerase sigma-70 factor (ECF subfamily)